MGKTKHPGGRPSKQDQIDQDQFTKMMQFKPQLKWMADFYNCSEDTIHNFCKTRFGCSFSEYRNKRMLPLRINLAQKCIQLALEQNNLTALIFALKNINGWADQPDPFAEMEQDSEIVFDV